MLPDMPLKKANRTIEPVDGAEEVTFGEVLLSIHIQTPCLALPLGQTREISPPDIVLNRYFAVREVDVCVGPWFARTGRDLPGRLRHPQQTQ